MNKLFPLGKNEMIMDGTRRQRQRPRMRIFAQRLRQLLDEERAKGHSEASVARDIGVPERLLNQWKNRGTITKDEAELHRLCKRLNTHPNYLTGWSDDRYPRGEDRRIMELEDQVQELKKEIAALRKRTY